MPTDFGFISNTTERHPNELPTCGTSDRLTERSFSNAWGTDETDNRAFQVFDELQNSEVLKHIFLRFLQAVMVLIQDAFSLRKMELMFSAVLPRQREYPIDISADNAGFSRLRWNLCKPLQFLECFFFSFFGHPGVFHLLPKLINFGNVIATEFLLDNLHLFL